MENWDIHGPRKKEKMKPKKSLGQHFLRDVGAAKAIIQYGQVKEGTKVLEVGPGRGFVTKYLLEAGAEVIAVEKDSRLIERLRTRFFTANFTVIEGDILEVDLSPFCSPQTVIVGNLPYNRSVDIMERLLLEASYARMLLMFQLEVANRITAKPGTKAYGVCGIIASAFCRTKIVKKLSPASFYPKPRVNSGLVLFEPLAEVALSPDSVAEFRCFLSLLFRQRRKTLKNALRSVVLSQDKWEQVMALTGLCGTERAEQLELHTLLQLFYTINHVATNHRQ